jgi:nicotinate-nucleotide adenylyltransferase
MLSLMSTGTHLHDCHAGKRRAKNDLGVLPSPFVRVALYGGSFNPPHLAHQLACAVALAAARPPIDEVWLVPTFVHAFGKALAPFGDRVAMCERAARIFGGRVKVSRIEEELGGASYTLTTWDAMVARFPHDELVLLIGADLAPDRPRWHAWAELASRARFLVVGRAGYPAPEDPAAPSHDERLPIDLPALSSTEARRRLAAGEPTAGILDEEVRAYAEAARLYEATP